MVQIVTVLLVKADIFSEICAPMEGDTGELEIDSELVMSFYDQCHADDLYKVIVILLFTFFLVFLLLFFCGAHTACDTALVIVILSFPLLLFT